MTEAFSTMHLYCQVAARCGTEAFSTTCTARWLPGVGLRHSVPPVLPGGCQVWD